MIIVDDGSTDKTAEVVSQFSDPRIRYFRQDHIGPWRLAETYNYALSESSGEYIAILEGDDYWPKNKLEIQHARMEKNPDFIISYGECRMVTESKKEIGYLYLPKERGISANRPIGSSLNAFLDLQLFVPALTVLIRRCALERIGGFQESESVPAVDYPTWLRLCLEGPFLAIENQCLGYWRRHKESISINYQLEAWEGMAKHNIRFLERYKKEIHELGFNFDGETIQEKLDAKLQKIRKNITFELGLLYLGLGQYELARRLLIKHLSNRPNYRDRGFVYLGLLSSLIRVDLVYQFRKVRDAIKKLIGKKNKIVCICVKHSFDYEK